ncbi:hypothetical protein NUW54_g13611 [Trametes sanguinea]|uniref:Uncharacterized protein n=1 Tax=Trametes sanguinea TaxID=158606 RepID=A0ACC1MKA3_9APHY|nr:hypothetical protein NUW54_g13611 [Trametes sanguinea]
MSEGTGDPARWERVLVTGDMDGGSGMRFKLRKGRASRVPLVVVSSCRAICALWLFACSIVYAHVGDVESVLVYRRPTTCAVTRLARRRTRTGAAASVDHGASKGSLIQPSSSPLIMSLLNSKAPYGPPALRHFTQTRSPQPTNAEIATERFKQRFNLRLDGNEHLNSPRQLHPHFCLSSEDRRLAHHEGMSDAHDAVLGASRLADTLFIGFGIRPEWQPFRPLRPSEIDVQVIATRQFEQNPSYKRAIEKIERIVREELAVPHILGFRSKLDQVTPGAGYAWDEQSRRIITHPVQLASDVLLPEHTAGMAQGMIYSSHYHKNITNHWAAILPSHLSYSSLDGDGGVTNATRARIFVRCS